MKLYLMRHCAADTGAQMDESRGLEDAGKAQAHTMRRFLKQADVKPDVIIASDFARAEETAEIMQRGDTMIKTTPYLRPDGDVDGAWKSILKLAGDSEAVLVVTHGPLIQPLLASVAFCFLDEKWNFEHGAIAYVKTDESRFRWFVSPKLAAHIVGDDPAEVENSVESVEIGRAALRLAENLMANARKAMIAPMRDKMHSAIAARWKRQKKRTIKAMKQSTGLDMVTAQAMLTTVIPFRDSRFAKAHKKIKADAYRAGVVNTGAQLGVYFGGAVQGIEADRKTVTLPFPTFTDQQSYNLEDELDQTTVTRAHNALSDLGDGFSAATAVGAITKLFDGFSAPAGDKLSRADTVALQTVSDGYHTGGADLAANARAAGMSVQKRWETGGAACEICIANEAEGLIDIDDPHQSGDDEPPAHPNCDCSEVYSLDDSSE